MKKIMMMAVMAIAALTANAQTSEVGALTVTPYAGVTFGHYGTKISALGVTEESKNHFGFTVGGELGYQLNSWLKASAGLAFTNTGSKFEASASGQSATAADFSANYLTIPVLANFYVADGLALKVGVQPSILLSGKETKSDIDCKNAMESFDLQIPVGVSYEYSNIVLDARYNIGVLKPFKKDNTFLLSDGHNQYFTITLGYKINL